MKNKNLTLLLLLFISVISAQKVIENPFYEFSKSGINHISKIELNNNETKIYIHNTFLSKWWVMFKKDIFIEDVASEKKYHVIAIKNAEFGKKIWMPASGEKTIVLSFPPLDKNVKKIDYNNVIYGVSLSKPQSKQDKKYNIPKEVNNWIDSELKKNTNVPLESYNSSNFFNKKKAKLIGYIKGYNVKSGFNTGIMYMGNDITREQYPIVVQIFEDGRFEAELPLTNPVYTYVRFDKVTIEPYLEPGQTLAMILDWEEFLLADRYRNRRYKFQNIIFKGSLAKINEDLANFTIKPFNYKSFIKRVKKQSPKEFKSEETQSYQNNKTILSSYINNNIITDKAKTLLENKIYLQHATHLFDFASRRKYEAKKDTLNKILKIPIENNYYNFLQEINLNDISLFVLDEFSTFANRFEFSEPLLLYPRIKSSKLSPKKSFIDYLKDENIKITEKDKELQESSKNKKFNPTEHKQHLAKFSKEYKNALENYKLKFIEPLLKLRKKSGEDDFVEFTLRKWQIRDSVVKNIFQLEKNLVHDLTKIRALRFDIDRTNTKNAHEYWNELKKQIDNPFLIEEGSRILNKKFPISNQLQKNNLYGDEVIKANLNASVTKLPDGKSTTIFKDIIAPYKGKILFIDFWATSCAPCIGSIKRMKETRKKHKSNKEFDFVFITDERSSPLKTYTKFINQQELKNSHRLSLDNYNYLRQLFKFNGIPRYLVIDKKGDVIDDDFKMYQFDYLLDDIIKVHK